MMAVRSYELIATRCQPKNKNLELSSEEARGCVFMLRGVGLPHGSAAQVVPALTCLLFFVFLKKGLAVLNQWKY